MTAQSHQEMIVVKSHEETLKRATGKIIQKRRLRQLLKFVLKGMSEEIQGLGKTPDLGMEIPHLCDACKMIGMKPSDVRRIIHGRKESEAAEEILWPAEIRGEYFPETRSAMTIRTERQMLFDDEKLAYETRQQLLRPSVFLDAIFTGRSAEINKKRAIRSALTIIKNNCVRTRMSLRSIYFKKLATIASFY